MFRIDGPGAVGELPVAREGVNAPGFFGPGNPATGQMSTRVTYEWLNAVQEEIAAVITDAGIDLSKENNAQLLAALHKLTVGPEAVFTPPTENKPGKAGLVPAPPMITERSIINQFLSGQGWRAITTALLGLDQITQTPVLVPTTQPLGIADANTIPAGFYNSEQWVNTPVPSGLLLTLQGIETEGGGYYAIQLFLDYGGKIWLRLAQSNEVPGTWPHWHQWNLIGTPRPQSATGLGEWRVLGNSPGQGASVALPGGGVWAYFLIGVAVTTAVPHGAAAGAAGGGTVVTVNPGVAPAVSHVFGFCYEVA